MPTFTPVDHDPFASDGDAPAAPATAPAISFSDGSGGGGPVFVPVDHDPFAGSADADAPRPLTIRGGRQPPSRSTLDAPIAGSAAVLDAGFAPARGAATSTTPAPADADALDGSFSLEDAFPSPTPHPGGALSNSADDGYVAGALKGAGTAAIKGVGQSVGFVGGLGGTVDYLMARAESAITGQPVEEVLADLAKKKAAQQAGSIAGPTVARLSDPRNVLPAPEDVSGPILAKTGEYVPTSELGRVGQAAVEGAVGAFGPGGGAISPGTAGKAVVGALARQAPAMVVAGGVGQAATDLTGDSLAGLAAGLVAPPLAEATASKAASALGPVVGGSTLLNKAPVIGPAVRRARENQVGGLILDAADDPAAVRAAVAQPAPEPAVPGSPQTFAGQIGTDQGLFEAEKALRNTKAEKLTDGSAPTHFNSVDRRQSAAQVAALQGLQPTVDVFAPGQAIRQRMDAIDAAARDAEDRLTAAHADAVSSRASSTQSFADQQRSPLDARQADRTQAGADFAGQQRADLADRTIARGQASGDAKDAADADRQVAHDALVQRFAEAHSAQLGAAQSAAAPLVGGPIDASDLGSTLRSSIEAVRAGAKGLHRDLYAKVDPNGTLALVATPVGDKATWILDGLKANGSELTPAETPLFRRATALPGVASYGMVHALDTDLSAAMSTERRASGESPAWARLSALKGAVKDAMNNAADNHAAWEARQVDAGRMALEDTIAARLRADTDEWDAAAQQPQARAATGTGDPAYPDAGTVGFFESSGAQVSGRGSVGYASGNSGLSPAGSRGTAPREVGAGSRPDAPAFDPDGPLRAPRRPDMPRPQHLQAFIRAHGGMTDPGGDLRSMGLHDLIAKPGQGVSQDRMRLMAAEAGYLGADTARAMAETHPNDLLDAVSGDRPVHSVRDGDAAAAWAAYDEAKEAHASARGEFGTRSRFGMVPERPPLDAYSRDDIEGPSGITLPPPENSGRTPNFDQGAANRLREANAAYAAYAKAYKNPIVGPGLRTTGYAGQYARSDAAFVKGAIKAGPEGYETARAYITAAKDDPEALTAMQDAALNPLRKATLGNGMLPAAALANWKSAEGYGPALRALDYVRPGFSSRFDTAAHAEQTLVDLGAAHKAALAASQKEAARQAIVENVQRREGLKQATAADRADVNALLAERKANDRAEGQADRAGVASSIADRRASDRALDAQSAADMRAGKSVARGVVSAAKATLAGQFGKVAGNAIASTEVENAVGSFLHTGTGGAARMRGLVASVSGDPEALAGLRKAGADWIVRTHMNADGTLSSAKLISFINSNRDTLGELYPHDQRTTFGALARDAEEGMRWRTSTAIKGGSDSAKNFLAALDKVEKTGGRHISVGLVAVEAISLGLEKLESMGWKAAGIAGMGAAVAYLGNTLRQAGIRNTADLYREAMANPELARAFISRNAGRGRRQRAPQPRPGAQARADRGADVDGTGRGTLMAKSGRKPIAGARYESGRIKPPHLRDVHTPPPTAIKRTMEAALRGIGDPRWGTVIGRLRLGRELTDRQFNAAEAYGRLRGRFDRMMGLPRRSARSCLYDIEAGCSAEEMSDGAIAALR